MCPNQARILAIFIAVITLFSASLADDAANAIAQLTTSAVGNPFVGGPWHYPASGRNFPNKLPVWIFAVHVQEAQASDSKRNLSVSALSSSDMYTWELHDSILDMSGFPWANATLQSPTPVYHNGKYYLYFSATGFPPDAATNERTIGNYSGIGVAVSDKPEGPYKNPLPNNTALIPADDPTITNPYGPDILGDSDGRSYIYHGYAGSLQIRNLDDDMTSFSNESKQVAASPGNYQGMIIFKKDNTYYLLWNDVPLLQSGPDPPVASRNIRYAISPNKNGPFLDGGFVLSADPAIAHTIYHGDAVNPTKDGWFLVYSRTQTIPGYSDRIDGLAFERMYFEPGGSITPVAMRCRNTFRSEYKLNQHNLPIGLFSNNTISIKPDPGSKKLKSYLQLDGKGVPEVVHAMTYTSFSDFELSVQFSFDDKKKDESTSAGAIFRASADTNFENWSGYLAEYLGNGALVLSKLGPGTDNLKLLGRNSSVPEQQRRDKFGAFYFKVRAEGNSIKVYGLGATYDDPDISVEDKTWSNGWVGMRAHRMVASFSSVEVIGIRSIVHGGFVLSGSDKGNPW